MIVMVEGQATNDIPRRLACELAREIGWLPQDYEIMEAPRAEAPFMVICPGENALRNAVWNSPYMIRPGVQVGIQPWDLDWNTRYAPPPFQAWVRLIGLPQQAWNDADIRKVAIPLGRVTGVLPYGRQAGHCRYITIRLACEHPETIPKNTQYHEGVRAQRVKVKLLGWRPWQQGPYPPPPEDRPNQHPPPQLPIVPQPEQNVPPPPELGTTQTVSDIPSSSGGSNSVQGPARGRPHRVWHIKQKLRQHWIGKKKEGDAHKKIEQVLQAIIDNTPRATREIPQPEIQRCKENFQILQVGSVVGMITLNLTAAQMSAQVFSIIKCVVLEGEFITRLRQKEIVQNPSQSGYSIGNWEQERMGQMTVKDVGQEKSLEIQAVRDQNGLPEELKNKEMLQIENGPEERGYESPTEEQTQP